MELFILIVVLLLAALVYLFYLLSQSKKQLAPYKGIIDIEEEIKKRQSLLEEEQNRIQQLKQTYHDKKEVFDKLTSKINLLEENLEIMDYGLYKPSFNFDTSDSYKIQLEFLYDQQKAMIKANSAVYCRTEWTVGGSKAEGRKMIKQVSKLMLRAFNGEADAAIAKVKWNNVNKMLERIYKAHESINKSGEVNTISITREYLELKINELKLYHEMEQKVYKEKELERQRREEMKEEEKALREMEQAIKAAESEEKMYANNLKKALKELESAKDEMRSQLEERIKFLEKRIQEAQELKVTAQKRATVTKSGYIYIISNIGSFGENIYKIGMTRRLEPLDRVKELGDASVPFPFDVHALVYSENAPELESRLHNALDEYKLNALNDRKEFFNAPIEIIEKVAKDFSIDAEIIKFPEAREFRESIALREKALVKETTTIKEFPDEL